MIAYLSIAAHKKRSKNEVCVCVYTGRWNDCKVTHVIGMNIGVSIFF